MPMMAKSTIHHTAPLLASGNSGSEKRTKLKVVRKPQIHELQNVEPVDAGLLVVIEVECQDAQQHQHATHQGIKEELDGGVELPWPTPDPDEEIHGDQHDFPEDVEEEEVEGHEDAQHPGLEKEHHHVKLFHALGDGRPGRQNGDEAEHGGEQDQKQADPVDAEEVLNADTGDPVVLLGELKLRSLRAEIKPERQRDEEAEETEDIRQPADEILLVLSDEEQNDEPPHAGKKDNPGRKGQFKNVVLSIQPSLFS